MTRPGSLNRSLPIRRPMAKVIDGRTLARAVREEVARETRPLAEEGTPLGLVALHVGQDPGAQAYLRTKRRGCEEVGIRFRAVSLPEDASEGEVWAALDTLNGDGDVHGIVVEQPLPGGLDASRLAEAVAPGKDVDGLHPLNLGRLLAGRPTLVPATPLGVRELLVRSGHPPDGRHVVVVGRSGVVGRPLAALLLRKGPGADATVTVCHSRTPDVAAHTRRADVVVVAVGRAAFLRREMVRPGAVVVDVGINSVEGPDGTTRLVGDVAYEEVAEVAGAITPVPGGVGPVTTAMLLRNVVTAARLQARETF